MESEWHAEESAAGPWPLTADGARAKRNPKTGTSHTALVRIRAPPHDMSRNLGGIMSAAGAEGAQAGGTSIPGREALRWRRARSLLARQRFQVFDQIVLLLRSQAEAEHRVVVVDDVEERGEAAVVIE